MPGREGEVGIGAENVEGSSEDVRSLKGCWALYTSSSQRARERHLHYRGRNSNIRDKVVPAMGVWGPSMGTAESSRPPGLHGRAVLKKRKEKKKGR